MPRECLLLGPFILLLDVLLSPGNIKGLISEVEVRLWAGFVNVIQAIIRAIPLIPLLRELFAMVLQVDVVQIFLDLKLDLIQKHIRIQIVLVLLANLLFQLQDPLRQNIPLLADVFLEAAIQQQFEHLGLQDRSFL